MKKQAGIFDPWRQTAVPPVDNTPAKKDLDQATQTDDAALHCVQFAGLRAGIFVWLSDAGEGHSARARAIVVDTVYRISAKDGAAAVLNGWGVYTGNVPQLNPVILISGEKKVTISVPVSDAERLVPRAIDNLALALREVSQQFPDAGDILSVLKVRPYLK